MLFRKHFVFFLLFFLLSSLFALPYQYTEEGEELRGDPMEGELSPEFTRANAAAIHWLNLLDQGMYASSWLDAGNLLKDVLTQDQWTSAMNGTRRPFGQVRSRQLNTIEQVARLRKGTRSADHQAFIVITYRTEFQPSSASKSELSVPVKAHSSEMLVMMAQGPLHLWRVVHYQIGLAPNDD